MHRDFKPTSSRQKRLKHSIIHIGNSEKFVEMIRNLQLQADAINHCKIKAPKDPICRKHTRNT